MKTLQLILVFIVAFSLGIYVERQEQAGTPPFVAESSNATQGCKTDLLVVFPFEINQTQLSTVMDALYNHYPEWSIRRDGASTLRVLMRVPKSMTIDEVKLESQAIGGEPALCFTPELRKEIEALAAETLQKQR
ncbi:MAG: hypothetical protein DYG89_28605 [Caldilinea sp. CFX5]|nr:hypothetical protein [Caldilinea sp. CFX5]